MKEESLPIKIGVVAMIISWLSIAIFFIGCLIEMPYKDTPIVTWSGVTYALSLLTIGVCSVFDKKEEKNARL